MDADYAQSYSEVRAGRYVLITVSDSGTGMSEEVRRRAFDPFFTTKPTGAGTGLELSMVYGFVKQSGGHIQIYSEIGRGTDVRVFLPLAERADAASAPNAQPANLPKGTETILLVEDNPRVRRVLGRRLRDLGYKVIEADTGAAAMAELATRPEIALVFTDMVMPGGITGVELAEVALAVKPELKILFTSGYAAPAIARLGQKKMPGSRSLTRPMSSQTRCVRSSTTHQLEGGDVSSGQLRRAALRPPRRQLASIRAVRKSPKLALSSRSGTDPEEQQRGGYDAIAERRMKARSFSIAVAKAPH